MTRVGSLLFGAFAGILPGRGGRVLAVLGLLVVSGFVGAIVPGASGAAPTAGPTRLSTPAIGPHAPNAPALGPPPATGRGTFFNNTQIPFPNGPGNQTCIYTSVCVNNSNDPSINLTSNGVLAVANTVYSNISACGNVSKYAQTEIQVTTSPNLGATWGSPRYLGNRDCAHANQYASAWEPSLTSLANGTLVLVYIEYNLTPYQYVPYVYFGGASYYSYSIPWAALVLTESYTNGASWTLPVILNASSNPGLNKSNWIPERPWVTAVGQTIYVAWMNYSTATMPDYSSYPPPLVGSSQVHLLVSTTGGSTWGSPIDLKVLRSAGFPAVAMNPSLLVSPTGELFVAYTSNWTFAYQYPSGCTTSCVYDIFGAQVVVASSTNNGSTLAYRSVWTGLGVGYRWSSFVDPSPQMAWGAKYHQLFVTWSGGQIQNYCQGSYCGKNTFSFDWIANSSTSGASWSTAHPVFPALVASGGQQLYNPAIAVTADGRVHLASSFVNQTSASCYSIYYCPQWEVYANSSDNGTSFGSAITVDGNATFFPNSPDGEYATMVAAGGQFWVAWSWEYSSGIYTYFPNPALYSQVTVSEPFRGAGVGVTFRERGLSAGTPWSINMLGNVRAANAPTALSITGVPPAVAISWNVSSVNGGYGVRYAANASVSPPAKFSGPTTIYENYTKQVLVNVTTIPNIPSCSFGYAPFCWNYTYYRQENYNITPGPQPNWVDVNSTFSESVVPNGVYTSFGYATWENLTFLSWTGDGPGSVNSTGYNITLKPAGPVNETANFLVNGYCNDYSWTTPNIQCTLLNQSLIFHETGLPAGLEWNVSVFGSHANATGSSSTPTLVIQSNATLGLLTYVVWTIPTATSGVYWIGTGSPSSPVQLPGDRVVNVTFVKRTLAGSQFTTNFVATGLPNATAWTLDLGGNSLGVQTPWYNTSLSGGSVAIGAETVYLNNGTAYYPSLLTVIPLVRNSTWKNYTAFPATVTVAGGARIIVTYSPEYWVTVTGGGAGGTVTPASQWVHGGVALRLNETAASGYYFVGWTGVGAGGVTTRTPNPSVSPLGPVTEAATFSPNPLPTYNITVGAVGLPAGVNFALTVGGVGYSGGSSFHITGVLAGDYTFSAATAYDNGTNGTRYVVSGVTTTFTQPSPGVVHVASNGWLNVSFATEYLVSVSSTGSGTVSPAPGSAWYEAGDSLTLTAAPSSHYQLAGWVGTGPGSISGSSLQIAPTVNGPITETAQFVWKATALPATFNLTVQETGLPAGLAWNVSVGSTGSGGSGASMTFGGLNGTYPVGVAIVYASSGVRYVPNNAGSFSQDVGHNAWLNVTFQKQFLLTVSSSSGGSVTPASEWVNAGATVTITATASNSTWSFAGWNGTTPSDQATVTLTVNSPTNEVASFSPVYTQTTTTQSSASGMPTALGLFVVLLVIALVVGLILGRRRTPPAAPDESAPMETDSATSEEAGEMGGEASVPPEPSAPLAEYDEGPAPDPGTAPWSEGEGTGPQ